MQSSLIESNPFQICPQIISKYHLFTWSLVQISLLVLAIHNRIVSLIWNCQVWAILRMAEVLLIRDLRKLDLETVPIMFRLTRRNFSSVVWPALTMIRSCLVRNLGQFPLLTSLHFGSSTGDLTVQISKVFSSPCNWWRAKAKVDAFCWCKNPLRMKTLKFWRSSEYSQEDL